MQALSIRQPYAELILRGLKTIEYRSMPTRKIDERFYIYVPKKWAGIRDQGLGISRDDSLPTGVIVGTAVISHCTNSGDTYQWHLTDVQRLKKPRKPAPGRMPQPVWFRPF